MFGRQRNLDTPKATPRPAKKAIADFQDGSLSYEEYKSKTRSTIKPITYRGSGRQKYHKLLMENSTPRSAPARTRPISASAEIKPSMPKLKFAPPSQKKSRLGAAGRQAMQGSKNTTTDAGSSTNAANNEPAGVSFSGVDVPHDSRPFSLEALTSRVPEHQLKVLTSDPMYTPDPDTGLSRWPIPGMQGFRTPFMSVPYATNGKATRTPLSAQHDSEMKAIENTRPFEKGNYQSNGLGSKPVWNGQHNMDELSDEVGNIRTISEPEEPRTRKPRCGE